MDTQKANNIEEAREFFSKPENEGQTLSCSKPDPENEGEEITSDCTSLEGAEAFYAESGSEEAGGEQAASSDDAQE